MKQTAVDFLLENLIKQNFILKLENEDDIFFKKLIQEAKEMEKEHIIDAIDYCRDKYIDSENYYNQEFNK